nr:AEC family transporter [Kineococcus aurantiacus]
MVVLAPAAVALLDLSGRSGRVGLAGLLVPLANPVLLASVAGIALSVTGWSLPTALSQPLGLLAGLAVPGALLAFGLSLHGREGRGWRAPPVLYASALKAFVQPLATWLVARALGLPDAAVYAATVVAALPTAQNVFTYAVRYEVGRELARDSVLVTTVLLAPVLLLVSVLLPH